MNGFKFINRKPISDLMYFYWLDNKIISCKWKHSEKAFLDSSNEYFLWINGLTILNDRSQKD